MKNLSWSILLLTLSWSAVVSRSAHADPAGDPKFQDCEYLQGDGVQLPVTSRWAHAHATILEADGCIPQCAVRIYCPSENPKVQAKKGGPTINDKYHFSKFINCDANKIDGETAICPSAPECRIKAEAEKFRFAKVITRTTPPGAKEFNPTADKTFKLNAKFGWDYLNPDRYVAIFTMPPETKANGAQSCRVCGSPVAMGDRVQEYAICHAKGDSCGNANDCSADQLQINKEGEAVLRAYPEGEPESAKAVDETTAAPMAPPGASAATALPPPLPVKNR